MSHELLQISFGKAIGEIEVRSIHGSDWVYVSNERTGESTCLRGEDALRDLHYALGELIRQVDDRRKSA